MPRRRFRKKRNPYNPVNPSDSEESAAEKSETEDSGDASEGEECNLKKRQHRVNRASPTTSHASAENINENFGGIEASQHEDSDNEDDLNEGQGREGTDDDNGASDSNNSEEEGQELFEDEAFPPSSDSEDDNVLGTDDESEDSEPNSTSEEENDSEDDSGSNSSSDEEEGDFPAEGAQPLYVGAPITLHESLVAIFSLAMAEHMTGTLLSKILLLVALHCPLNNLCKRTLHRLKRYFAKVGKKILIFHYFCSVCVHPLKSKDSACPKCKKQSTDYCIFIEMPLLNQLQALFLRPRFFDDLQYRFHRNNADPTVIGDIYDGRIYKEQVVNGFLSNPSNVSFMLWFDGMQVFKSSMASSIWPVCLVINELPYHKRILPRNILIAGIWYGRQQPNPNLILKPLRRSMRVLTATGVDIKLPNGEKVVVRARILCATCDLPAKAKFMRMKQSGSSSCAKCVTEGTSIRTVKGGNVSVFPYEPQAPLRTPEQMEQHGQEALRLRIGGDKKATVCGIKGPTILSSLLPNIVTCMAIDVMHGAFLGVCKWLMYLWFDPKFSNCAWSLHASLNVVDSKIKQMRPPSFVQRPLRSIKDALPHWKASEFKLFLLYYSVPVLCNIMTDEYFKHHCYLVSALSLLCQSNISIDQVRCAKNLLHQYLLDFSRLYSQRYLVMVFHQLCHLADSVLDLGPLWVTSCFFLENLNGVLGKLYHGTRHVATQICSSFKLTMEMPLIIENLPLNSPVRSFCVHSTFKERKCKISDRISADTFSLGKYSNNKTTATDNKHLLQVHLGRIISGKISVFYRLKKQGVIYSCSEYLRSKCKESSFIVFADANGSFVGRVLRFVKWQNCGVACPRECNHCEVRYFIIVKQYEHTFWYPHENPGIRFPHFSKVKPTAKSPMALPLAVLSHLVFYIKIDNDEFIANPLNTMERE